VPYKQVHELRDPVHSFIYFSPHEKQVIGHPAVQRLRNIHQLALSYLVYPGATHRRFEHSLGTMEVASRIYAVVTREDHRDSDVRDVLPELDDPAALQYWRRVLRIAGLCHDLGHLPFSHAAEELLPDGWNHEQLSRLLIDELSEVLNDPHVGPINPEQVVKLALARTRAR
jgi:HD superfamily phosphohydrolase